MRLLELLKELALDTNGLISTKHMIDSTLFNIVREPTLLITTDVIGSLGEASLRPKPRLVFSTRGPLFSLPSISMVAG
jgi:hypothetical protein